MLHQSLISTLTVPLRHNKLLIISLTTVIYHQRFPLCYANLVIFSVLCFINWISGVHAHIKRAIQHHSDALKCLLLFLYVHCRWRTSRTSEVVECRNNKKSQRWIHCQMSNLIKLEPKKKKIRESDITVWISCFSHLRHQVKFLLNDLWCFVSMFFFLPYFNRKHISFTDKPAMFDILVPDRCQTSVCFWMHFVDISSKFSF